MVKAPAFSSRGRRLSGGGLPLGLKDFVDETKLLGGFGGHELRVLHELLVVLARHADALGIERVELSF